MDGFKMMMDTAKFACVKVLGAANHITFVGGDGSIYGMGSRIQRMYS